MNIERLLDRRIFPLSSGEKQLIAIASVYAMEPKVIVMEDVYKRQDMERLHEAREILLHRLDCPPTLLELSRLIQMNDFKMKRLFKQYYGKTIYQYVREERLEKAFSLLQDGQHNVSQTAFAVGYTNTVSYTHLDVYKRQTSKTS